MVKFKIPIKDILGKAYYRYELQSTHYNTTPTQTDITITCTVKNIFGNPVNNKEITLYYKNDIQGTATTNANGIATWTVGNLEYGINQFRVENATILINVRGWETQTVTSYGRIYYNNELRMCEFRYYRANYNFTSTSEITLHSATIPSTYRPKQNIILVAYNQSMVGAVNTNGDILIHTTSTGTKNINITGVWHY